MIREALACLSSVILCACTAQGWHPQSHLAMGHPAYHQEVAAFEGRTALVTTVKDVPDVISIQGDVTTVLETRRDIEVISRYASTPLPDDDLDMARGFVRAACNALDEEAFQKAHVVTAPGGYYRFQGARCSLNSRTLPKL